MMSNVKKLIKRKKSSLTSSSRSMSEIMPVKLLEDKEYTIESSISSPLKVKIRSYDLMGLIVISLTTSGLLTLYDPISFMEDYVDVSSFDVKGKTYDLFAVYDGHGGRDANTGLKNGGHQVAQECVSYLPLMIKDGLKRNNNIEEALVKSFEKADERLVKDFPENVGTTAVVILKHDNKLYIANLGDSRAVICKNGKVDFETEDFDWTNTKEQKRIGINKDNQSCIVKTKLGDKKFIFNGKHLNGEKWNLATSRSFGDYHFKLGSDKPPVLSTPETRTIIIDESMKLILIASDGIWENTKDLISEHFTSKFIQIVKKQALDNPTNEKVDECLKEACKEFVKWCIIDHLKLDFKNYGDNISLVVIGLLNRQNKVQWFQEIQQWQGKYEDDNLILKDINDSTQEENQEDIDYGSDSESCKVDFTQL